VRGTLDPLRIGDLEIRIPILQGAMGVLVSDANLVAAVSEAGAAGTFAAVGCGLALHYEDAFRDYAGVNARTLRQQIREIRSRTSRPFGVNVMMALTDRWDLTRIASEEEVDFIVSGAGLPLDLPAHVPNPHIKLIPIVSAAVLIEKICRSWHKRHDRLPDAFVIESPLAGGHLGISWQRLEKPDALEEFQLSNVIPKAVEMVRKWEEIKGGPIPIIAAGGVFDGSDIAKYLKMGASGVQLGTRFVCTRECQVSDEFKRAYVEATEDDIAVIHSPVGLPLRVIKNEFYERLMRGDAFRIRCPYHCLETCNPREAVFCIAEALVAARNGDMVNGAVTCSANAYRIKEITTVPELLDTLVRETLEHLEA